MDNRDEELEQILKEIKSEKKSDFSLQVETADGKAEEQPPKKEAEAPFEPEIKEEPVSALSLSEEDGEPEEETKPEEQHMASELVNPDGEEYEEDDAEMPEKNNKKIIIIIAAVVAVIAIGVGVYFGFFNKPKEEPTTLTPTESTTEEATTEAPVVLITNPLTGVAEYNADAVGKRPVAVVVENSAAARPQYNMDTPDIIVEGEVEGGITRMLWLYADMTALPDQVGPVRSARPPFVKFSEFFDSIFIHYGESHSKGSYTGADDVIASDGVDNINGMSISSCFKRTSDKVSPHNAALIGGNLVDAINNQGYRTDINDSDFSILSFNQSASKLSDTACSKITLKFSSRTDSHTFTYNADTDKYSNSGDYGQLVEFTNIIVMQVNTQYVVKENYKGSGNSETYCDYNYTSGTGKVASNGTVVDFNWENTGGVLKFTNAATGEALALNPGRSYLALASANNGSSITTE